MAKETENKVVLDLVRTVFRDQGFKLSDFPGLPPMYGGMCDICHAEDTLPWNRVPRLIEYLKTLSTYFHGRVELREWLDPRFKRGVDETGCHAMVKDNQYVLMKAMGASRPYNEFDEQDELQSTPQILWGNDAPTASATGGENGEEEVGIERKRSISEGEEAKKPKTDSDRYDSDNDDDDTDTDSDDDDVSPMDEIIELLQKAVRKQSPSHIS
eukprot:GILJ01026403.1.p1 GENE.GILJ01026403.1~~GILJ01026403.1.p1  ORF type:complete len:213 (+),score=39.73 GILJ01026403.1:3-641(+)